MLAAVSIFTLASLGCLLATDIWGFLLFRMLQGAIISGYAVSMAVIRDMTPARKAASLMGYVAVGWALGPMLGPLLGGALDRSEEHTSELQSLMRISYAVFCFKK